MIPEWLAIDPSADHAWCRYTGHDWTCLERYATRLPMTAELSGPDGELRAVWQHAKLVVGGCLIACRRCFEVVEVDSAAFAHLAGIDGVLEADVVVVDDHT